MPGIIKSNGHSDDQSSTQGVVFNFEDISSRAQDYLDSIKQQADQLLQQAREQTDQVRAQAVQEGRQQALQQARQEIVGQLDQRMQTALPAIQAAADALHEQRANWECHWEQQVVRLAVKIAEKIVCRELANDPSITVDWLRQSLELISRQEQVTVELAPDDLDALGQQVETLATTLGRLAPTRVSANPTLTPGDCRVLTRHGEIDHRLETQLERLESELA